jgi:hypothetical protein
MAADARPLDEVTGAFADAAVKLHCGLDGLHRVVNKLAPSASPALRVNRPGIEAQEKAD